MDTSNMNIESMMEMLGSLKNINMDKDAINKAIGHFGSNPQEMMKFLAMAKNVLPADTFKMLESKAQSVNPHQVVQQMMKQGVNPNKMRKQYKAAKKLAGSTKRAEPKYIEITSNRQIKQRQGRPGCTNMGEVVSVACSHLSIGVIDNIVAWYDSKDKRRNKLATKVMGFDVGGDVYFTAEGHDILLDDFQLVLERIKI